MSLPPPPAPSAARSRIPELNWADAHRADIQMRYSDIDTNHHVNNGRYGEYLENARVMLLKDAGVSLKETRVVLARMEMDYVHEIHAGQVLVVESLVEKLGRSSLTLVSRILADGLPCAFGRVVMVHIGPSLQPEPVADTVRERLMPLLVRP